MSRWSWIALGAGAYVAFVLASFPAGTALRWFAPPGLVAVAVEGTVWSGRVATASVGGLALEQLRWRLRPVRLLLGRLAGSVEARVPDGFFSGDIEASGGRVVLRNLRGATSLPSLATLLPVRGIRGQASVALDSLELVDGWPTSAVGELKLANLEATSFVPSGNGAMLALGDYTVTFASASAQQLAAVFVDNGGPLEVTGTVTLDAARAYLFDALIKPRPGAAEQLVQGLEIMTGEPDAEGRRRLTMTGSL